MKGGKVFVDTNIIVYAYDPSAGEKHLKAAEVMSGLWESGNGVVSIQVLQEFFVTATRKMGKPMDAKTAKTIVGDLLKWKTVTPSGETLLDAIDICGKHQCSFWDAMIISSALEGGAEKILTEDFTHGQKIRGLQLENPFRE
ncbi:MAG: PIN domain-containing protein [Nitrospinae bacterium]|nr:PIN domain-containing protein [Nitrospinota bacterium]